MGSDMTTSSVRIRGAGGDEIEAYLAMPAEETREAVSW